MNICEDGHEAIAYEGNFKSKCPLCEMMAERDELEGKLEEKDNRILELEGEIEELESKEGE